MQDKDFDKLFKSKFEDFEAEPSSMIWENIAGELDDKKAKRSWMPYLSIAAGIAVVFTACLLFLRKQSAPAGQHHNYASLIHHDIAKPVIMISKEPAVKQPDNKITGAKIAETTGHHHKEISPTNNITQPVAANKEEIVKDAQPQKADPQLIAQLASPINNTLKPTMPDVQLAPKVIDLTVPATERPVTIASTGKEDAESAKRHGIHNLGGLINVLVAKVDKRQDKLIQFSDDDDDDAETSVTGVNLGPIKIKKQ